MENEKRSPAPASGADAWLRFESAVDAAVKSGPKHKTSVDKKARPASKGRVHKGKSKN